MDTQSIIDFWSTHVPEVILIIGGIIALLIAYTYLKNDLSKTYKFMMALGVIFGATMIFLTVTSYSGWGIFTAIVIAATGFALVIRPFREVHFAMIFSILIMVVVYILLANLVGTQLDVLAQGWYRVGVAFVCGAIVYMIASFAEKLIMLFGKLFNWWPFLGLLGCVCIFEGCLILAGYGSIYDYFQ
ncbi:MAG: hypothetical protein M0P07_05135 [Candidatus Methanomethylophilaceae archaeon]|nr:hypothetical protein [Candidatus Methanomethylophilaceae archaeon]